MIRATVVNGATMQIAGMNPAIPRRDVREWLEDVAELADQRIAKDWSNERAAGRAMAANTEATDQRKAAEGLELKVGTATGNLQDHLDRGGYWTIGAIAGGRATITWDESALQADVEYAEYVADLKVSGDRILVLLQKDARMAEQYLRDREADWLRASPAGRDADERGVSFGASRRSRLGAKVRA